MIKLKIQSYLFLIINLNKVSISLRKGENIIEINEENLESLKSSLESYKCTYEVLQDKKTESEVNNKDEEILENSDEEFLSLQQEAKVLGVKCWQLIKSKDKLIEKINESKNTKSPESTETEEANK